MELTQKQTRVPTYQATIAVGLMAGYHGKTSIINEVILRCNKFADMVGICVTVTETTFVYTQGSEPGALVNLINYPRFPQSGEQIKQTAIDLATQLKTDLEQLRITVICTDESIMIGEVE